MTLQQSLVSQIGGDVDLLRASVTAKGCVLRFPTIASLGVSVGIDATPADRADSKRRQGNQP